MRTSFAESSNAVKSAGENTKTLSERVGGLAAKFTSWLTVSQIVMKLYSSLKKMVSAVIDIDTAMTELKKVTDETSTVYAKYLDDASVRAKSSVQQLLIQLQRLLILLALAIHWTKLHN